MHMIDSECCDEALIVLFICSGRVLFFVPFSVWFAALFIFQTLLILNVLV